MTTASVYYHRTGEPDFIMIDGDQAEVPPVSGPTDDYRLSAVDAACKTLGWKVMPHARIVRQADGRGTVRIEPHSLRPGLPPRQETEPALRHGVAHVRQEPSADESGVTLITVAVDGQVGTDTTSGTLGDLDPMADRAARDSVDEVLAGMTYVRTGPLVPAPRVSPEEPTSWTCTADPADGRSPDPVGSGPPMARVGVNSNGVPWQVQVGVQVAPVRTLCSLGSLLRSNRDRARAAVDEAIRQLGHRRTGDLVSLGDGWMQAAVAPADWSDHPTLVRMSDTTATALNRTAELLGIPADELAEAWILAGSAHATATHDRYLRDLADHNWITGWTPHGTPRLGG